MTGISDGAAFVVELLSKGYSEQQAATIAQISYSAVSQLAKQYAPQIQEGRTEQAIVARTLDMNASELEAKVLERLAVVLPLEVDTMKLLAAYKTLNGAKRRSQGEGHAPQVVHNNVVQLTLAAPLRKREIVVNSNNEVVTVGDTHLVTAGQQQIKNMQERREAPLSLEDFEMSIDAQIASEVEAMYESHSG